MPWFVLFISAIFEAVWATALGQSNGFTLLIPTLVFLGGLALSMATLGYAARHIPISTAYAVWTGTGAALTVAYAMLTGEELVSVLKVLFLVGIVCAVVGLKLIKAPAERPEERRIPIDPSGSGADGGVVRAPQRQDER
ncbi:Quaternary ammonium compound-resistance protein SugE (modular protein) [Microbacterium sp. C448]|uniref:DMT family transporter n=1 Tax=Microbacterium sp. C448 TaxID=1177594 RepID=UPI0003DE5DEC|nr:multidrug efflux SMR transporter [Microbacterium sp. C448]CDK01612.1 Quaternary ammonium compound-resistance protein SugE (modular protein) [Microbacterium sp. C448]